MAARPSTAASGSSKPAADRARARPKSTDSDLRARPRPSAEYQVQKTNNRRVRNHACVSGRHPAPLKKRGGKIPAAPQLLNSLVQAPRAPMPSKKLLAGDPSEVTALDTRQWITSFRWLMGVGI